LIDLSLRILFLYDSSIYLNKLKMFSLSYYKTILILKHSISISPQFTTKYLIDYLNIYIFMMIINVEIYYFYLAFTNFYNTTYLKSNVRKYGTIADGNT